MNQEPFEQNYQKDVRKIDEGVFSPNAYGSLSVVYWPLLVKLKYMFQK